MANESGEVGIAHPTAEAVMSEDKLGLHVDTDWKKQAQEEKRKLAEQEEKRKEAAAAKLAEIRRSLGGYLLNSLLPSHTSGSYLRSTARSFSGMIALSVILMCSGHTSVQHLVMLQ